MTQLSPLFDAQAQHFINIRFYYEAPNFAGMVYHADYLRFFERRL